VQLLTVAKKRVILRPRARFTGVTAAAAIAAEAGL
jgi:hypothetical protein